MPRGSCLPSCHGPCLPSCSYFCLPSLCLPVLVSAVVVPDSARAGIALCPRFSAVVTSFICVCCRCACLYVCIGACCPRAYLLEFLFSFCRWFPFSPAFSYCCLPSMYVFTYLPLVVPMVTAHTRLLFGFVVHRGCLV